MGRPAPARDLPKDKTTVREDACGERLPIERCRDERGGLIKEDPGRKRQCLIYEVELAEGSRAVVWFAKDFPGPPIVEVVRDAEPHQVSLKTLLLLEGAQ